MDVKTSSARLIRSGDPRAIARLISLIEREDPSRLPVLKDLHLFTGKAHIIGITGPPGAGKSTLTDKVLGALREQGRKVAVIAVDPSSPFTGGAILGDRIRMQRHATDEGVFIRSLATRGHLGGLSRAASEASRVLDAAGFDDVIIETVGVGQSEVDIVRIADTVVLVSVPGLGDDIQAIKAGVMEIGDVFCVNKADLDGAQRVVREIRSMLETAVFNGATTRFTPLYTALDALTASTASNGKADHDTTHDTQDTVFEPALAAHHAASSLPGHPNFKIPEVVSTVAETGQGIHELVDAIKSHEAALCATGFLRKRRQENLAWELSRGAAQHVLAKLEHDGRKESMIELSGDVLDKNIDYYDALEMLAKALLKA